MSNRKLSVGEIVSYPREFSPASSTVDGVTNFRHVTHLDNLARYITDRICVEG